MRTSSPATREVNGLDRLRAEIAARASGPYLLTVTSGGRPHCGTATVTWDGPDGPLTVRPGPRTWAESEAAGFRQVTLLWPPTEPGGYDLIADGTATLDGEHALTVTVSRAVLHRRRPAPASGGGPGCDSDCVPLTG